MIFGIFYEIVIEARLLITGQPFNFLTGKLTTGKLSADKVTSELQ
jgi:hypothetical protein